MPEGLDSKQVIEHLIRLRRVERLADERVREDIERVSSYLERLVGPTVRRSEAARLLGVSHTALDRWIDKGEIAAVVTPRGRKEVPLPEIVDLLEQIKDVEEHDRRPSLASVIRERRQRAQQIDEESLLPRRRRPRKHRTAELYALAYHRAVARRLDERIVSDARRRLRRWRSDQRIDPRWADEWERVLEMPLPRIARLIESDGDRARMLRQTSPFPGVLTEQERRRVLRAVRARELV